MKRIPFIALALSAVLFAFAVLPAAATPAFPADGDTYVYELRGNVDIVNASGPDSAYPLEMDFTFEFVNHTGNEYYQNVTVYYVEPAAIFLDAPNTTFFSLKHVYDNNGLIRQMYPINPANWTEEAPAFLLDLFFIPKETNVGDVVAFGAENMTGPIFLTFDLMMGPSTPVTIGTTVLNTVGVGFGFYQGYTGIYDNYTSIIEMSMSLNMTWEWSLGFLTSIDFMLWQNLNPENIYNANATEVTAWGSFALTSFTTQDQPYPMVTTPPIPGIPGFPIEAIIAGLLVTLIPLIIIRKRRR